MLRVPPASCSILRAALVLLPLLGAGCPRAPVARPYPPPSAAELVAHLERRAARVGPLRSEAKVDYFEGRGERVKVTMSFLVTPPAQLRIEAESPIGGATLASLASDGRSFQLLDVEHNRYLTGPAEPCNIARLIRVALAPEAVVAVLTGGAPLLGEPTGVAWKGADGGREVLTLRGPRGDTEIIELEARDRRWNVRRVELRDASGQLRYHLEHEGFDAGDPPLPEKTHVIEPGRKVDLLIRYRERERNVIPPQGAFHLEAPVGLAAEEVSCEGEE